MVQITNQITGNKIRFGGRQFKRLYKIQIEQGTKYFRKKDLATCKTHQQGGVVDPDINDRKYNQKDECIVCMDGYDDKKKKIFQIDECKHELCMQCAKRWFVTDRNQICPACKVEVNNEIVRKQIKVEEQRQEHFEIIQNLTVQLEILIDAEQNKNKKTEMERILVQIQNLTNEQDLDKKISELGRMMVQLQNLFGLN